MDIDEAAKFMTALLYLMPKGMPGRLLLDVMEERGITKNTAAQAIHRSLDRGHLVLMDSMNIGLQQPVPEIGIGHTKRGFTLIEVYTG